MEKTLTIFLCSILLNCAASAQSSSTDVETYFAGPNMGDPQPGDPDDRLIIEIEGDRAKKIFDTMPGTGEPMGCYDRPTKKARGLLCSSDEDGKYWCSVGIKFDTGETVIGSIC